MQFSFIFTKDFTFNNFHKSGQFAFWGREVGIYLRFFFFYELYLLEFREREIMRVCVIMEVGTRILDNRVHNS